MLRKFIQTTSNLIGRASQVFLVFAGALIVFMMFATSYGVLRRYMFNSPEPYSYEITTMFLLFSFVFAVSAVDRLDRHIRADFISSRLSERAQNIILNIVAPVLGLYFSVLLTWKSFSTALFSLQIGEVSSSIWAVPLFPIKVMVPIGYFMLALVLLTRMYKGIIELRNSEEKEGDEL